MKNELLKKNEKMALALDAKFMFTENQFDGGLIEAFRDYMRDGEPRTKMISLVDIISEFIDLISSTKEANLLTKIRGFKDHVEALEELLKLKRLFIRLTDWKIDAYFHFQRLRDKSHIYEEFELETLSQLYLEENGSNTKERPERVLTANTIRKWLDDEEKTS